MMRRFGILLFAWTLFAQSPLKFMRRTVTIISPGYEDKEHMFPNGPATICLEGSPRQCYTAPKDRGGDPHAIIVQVNPSISAIFFSAASGGVSGIAIHFALVRPGRRNELENSFPADLEISNQGQHAWWTDSSISDAKIFLSAEYNWGPGEGHYDNHRYIVSAWALHDDSYHLEDRYMTARKYDTEKDHVLDTEKPEILARLKRVKQQSPRQ